MNNVMYSAIGLLVYSLGILLFGATPETPGVILGWVMGTLVMKWTENRG